MNDFLLNLVDRTISGKGDSDAHLMTLFSICIGMKAKTIVELGVRDGSTTLPFLLAAHMIGAHVVSVDKKETAFQCPEYLRKNWTFIHSDAVEFLERWDREKVIDVVYVDDWHSYEHVKRELELIDMFVSPRSVVLFHDLMYGNWAPHYHCDLQVKKGQWANGGPYRAVAELDQNFWEFATLPYCNGLTILRKKYSNLYHR